jgi:hypothetical protein
MEIHSFVDFNVVMNGKQNMKNKTKTHQFQLRCISHMVGRRLPLYITNEPHGDFLSRTGKADGVVRKAQCRTR